MSTLREIVWALTSSTNARQENCIQDPLEYTGITQKYDMTMDLKERGR
jgi:hypothetical protein